ncbi:acyltransferase [uncultured Vagococcus sp.]|uniref:acyltransferase n=1 Tax=uncultured Vagococcus sp. TaxID=189676 RepID=UPI0028D74506|nr:acyltransferase [uncultured Vagococcus sp.]
MENRTNWLWMRAMAIIGVIAIHSTANSVSLISFPGVFFLLINQVSRFAVPTFLIASGFGLTVSKKYNEPYFLFLYNRLKKIIIPYVLWSAIYFILSGGESVTIFLANLVLGLNYSHLYYVVILVFFYVTYPFFYKVASIKPGIQLITTISICSQLMAFIPGYFFWNTSLNVISWCLFFSFGIFLAKSNMSLSINPVTLFGGSAILMLLSTIIILSFRGGEIATTTLRPSVSLYSFFFVMMMLSFKIKKESIIINFFAKNSFQIYLSHGLFLAVMSKALFKVGANASSFMYVLICFVGTLILTSIFVYFLNNVNLLLNNLNTDK